MRLLDPFELTTFCVREKRRMFEGRSCEKAMTVGREASI
jgi:hypothetical protein